VKTSKVKTKSAEQPRLFGCIHGEADVVLTWVNPRWTPKQIKEGLANETLEVLPPDENGVGAINTEWGLDEEQEKVAEFKLEWTGDPVGFEPYDFGGSV